MTSAGAGGVRTRATPAGGGAPAGGGVISPLEAAADALLSGGDAVGRRLRGSSGDGWVGVDPVTHVAPHVAIWEETYHDCKLLYASQVTGGV